MEQFYPNNGTGVNSPAYSYRATRHKKLPRARPLPYGSLMNALLQLIENTSKRDGFSHAGTEWLSSQLGCTEPYVNQMLRRLSYEYGRIRIREVEGSHERHFYPVPLTPVFSSHKSSRKSSQNLPRESDTLATSETLSTIETLNTDKTVSVAVFASPKEEEKETVNEASAVEHSPIPADPESETLEVIAAPPLSSPAAVPEPDIRAQLLAELRREGINGKRAAELVEKFPPRRVSRSLTYVRRMTENKPPETVGNRAGYIISAITHGYAEGLDMAMVGKSLPPDRMKRREAQKPSSAGVPPYHLPFREEDETPPPPAVWRPSGDRVTPPEKVATAQEVEAILGVANRSVRASDADLDRLPPAMAERARRRREQEREGVK